MTAKTKPRPKPTKKPAAKPQPPAETKPRNIRNTPVTGAPRARLIRVGVTEYWGSEYIPGRGKTYRIYAENPAAALDTITRINKDLHARAADAQKEVTNENQPAAQ